jgi:hypothetical protein
MRVGTAFMRLTLRLVVIRQHASASFRYVPEHLYRLFLICRTTVGSGSLMVLQ